MMNLLGRLTGLRIVAAALALLTLGAVFAATAAPREALATTTRAVRQTLAAAPPLSQTITATAPWSGIVNALNSGAAGSQGNQLLTGNQIGESSSQLHGDFDHGLVHLAPPAADWMSMTSVVHQAVGDLPGACGAPVKIEVSYRQPFSQYLRLVACHFPGPVPPAPRRTPPPHGHVFSVNGVRPPLYFSPLMEVVVTAPTAARFGLHPGSRIVITGPQQAFSGSGPITLEVTGIVAPRDPSATFWTADPAILTPDFVMTSPLAGYWVSGVLVGPSELAAVQQDFGPEGLAAQWLFPLSVGSPGGDQVGPLDDALTRLGAQTPPLTGASRRWRPTSPSRQTCCRRRGVPVHRAGDRHAALAAVREPGCCVLRGLPAYRPDDRAAPVGRTRDPPRPRRLAAPGRCDHGRRHGGRLRGRGRGGRPRGACSPRPGAGRRMVGVGGRARGRGLRPAIARSVAAAAAAPSAMATERPASDRLGSAGRRGHRDRRLGGGNRHIPPAGHPAGPRREPVHERRSRTDRRPRGDRGAVDLPAGAARRAARRGAAGRGAAFLGLARAARGRRPWRRPAFALVLALSVSAFAGMATTAVSSGDVRASWQAAGADATVSASILQTPGAVIDPAALRAAETCPA